MKINIHPKFITKQAEKFIKANAPTILTVAGAVGVAGTAYFTGKATVKAVKLIEDARYDKGMAEARETGAMVDTPTLTKQETFLKVWKLYIPAVGAGLASIGCMVMANRINTKRLTAAVAAYTLAAQNHEEYREKVAALTSKGKEQRVRDEVAKDKVASTPRDYTFNTGYGETLFMDGVSGRYFLSDIEAIKKAANDVNYMMLNAGMGERSASLSDFYDKIGLPHTGLSDNIGWNTDTKLELDLSAVLVDEESKAVLGAPIGEPVTFVSFIKGPFPDFS